MSAAPGSPVDDAFSLGFRPMELLRDRPVRRDLTCVNVAWAEKEKFDRIQDLLSGMAGRRLTQWEAFVVAMAVVEERFEVELRAFRR